MKISYNWLQTYFDEKIPLVEKLGELFTFHVFEVEGIEEVKDARGKIIDWVLDVKVLPDRAHYALSHNGIATEVSMIAKLTIKDRYASELSADIAEKPKIKIQNEHGDTPFCRRYVGRMVDICATKDSIPRESPAWLKDALHSIGQRSINPIVDVTNYVMYDIGQPIHAFDADKVKGNISIRVAKDGEEIELLPESTVVDGEQASKERSIILTSDDYVIADDQGPLVIAGVKGGRRAEVSESTTKIIIESANFDPAFVRRTSTKFDIRSDSSKRFENEITPELAIHGMNNVCALIKKIMPSAKFGPIVDEYPIRAKQTVFQFDPAYIKERLGMEVPLAEAKNILEGMGIVVEEKDRVQSGQSLERKGAIVRQKQEPLMISTESTHNKPVWVLTIPFKRLDLSAREDIVEEVGRIYGYERIWGIIPEKNNIEVPISQSYYLSERIRDTLVSVGFSEVSLYSLVSKGHIEIAKPLAKDKAFARDNLIDGMAICIERNVSNVDLLGLDIIKVFEIGRVFSKDKEKVHLVIGVSQPRKVKGLKGNMIINDTIQILKDRLGIEIDGRDIMTKNTSNFSISELDMSDLLKSLKPVKSYGDIDFEVVSNNRYKSFSLYPFIIRDIAVFVPESIQANTVWESIKKGLNNAQASTLLVRYSLFDVFNKDGKVSYAFRMIFQSMDRTLTDKEANQIMATIGSVMKEKGWQVR
jgi:phenylalanyl-tRNA synthetase beta chain